MGFTMAGCSEDESLNNSSGESRYVSAACAETEVSVRLFVLFPQQQLKETINVWDRSACNWYFSHFVF